MMKLIIRIQILLIILFLFYSCIDEKSTNPDTSIQNENYFPNSPGSNFKYEVTAVDSNGDTLTGNRIITYDGDSLIERTNYQVQFDTLDIFSIKTSTASFFRTTETGVFYFIDTTTFTGLIPDSIKPAVDLQTEMRLFLFPLVPGNTWTVYRISYDFNNQFGYNIINFSANYSTDEELQLNLNGMDKLIQTKKVEYMLTIQNDPETPLQNYEATIWLADNIGIVKLEGDAVILGIFNGGGILLSGTSAVITQKLVEYNLE